MRGITQITEDVHGKKVTFSFEDCQGNKRTKEIDCSNSLSMTKDLFELCLKFSEETECGDNFVNHVLNKVSEHQFNKDSVLSG